MLTNFILSTLVTLADPCVIEITEPTTVYVDGLAMLLADGTDVTGCDLATERAEFVKIEATVDVIVEFADNEPALLRETESIAAVFGDYLIGFVGDPETCDEDICCYPIYIPFVGWTYHCSACAGGAGVRSNAGNLIEIAFEKPEPKW
jgi:hypothetical protein